MPPLRLLLIMLLTVVLDLTPATSPHSAMAETAEEAEDATHAQRRRRPLAHVRDTRAPKIAHEIRDQQIHRARWRAPALSSRVNATGEIRKLPPSVAEAPPGPEDH